MYYSDEINEIQNYADLEIKFETDIRLSNYFKGVTDEMLDEINVFYSFKLGNKGFGNTILMLENEILEEDADRVYPFETIKKHLKSDFEFNDWQIRTERRNSKDNIILIFIDNDENNDLIISKMISLGWKKEKDESSEIFGYNVKVISFGALYQDNVNEKVRQNSFLYHWIPAYNEESIVENGLVPNLLNKIYTYPPRLHFMSGTIDKKNLVFLGRQLCANNTDKKNDGRYILLKIYTEKIPRDTQFFFDPRYEGGYYTTDKIPPSAIVKIGEVKLK